MSPFLNLLLGKITQCAIASKIASKIAISWATVTEVYALYMLMHIKKIKMKISLDQCQTFRHAYKWVRNIM